MKKIKFLLLLSGVFWQATFCNAQVGQRSMFYDAFYLKQFAILNKNEIIRSDSTKELLRFYFGDVVDTGAAFQRRGNRNPFLSQFIPSASSGLTANLPKLSNIVSAVGGIDVTTIADGFAKFIVKRTKQELTIAFFEKFKQLIAQPEYVDLQTVFPQTYQALTIIGTEIYNYQGYIQTLRETFERDLNSLATNLPSIVSNHPSFFQFHKDLAVTLKSGCYIAAELRDKVHPGDILNDYPSDYLKPLNPNFKGAIQTLQLISASLRDTVANKDSAYWVSVKQIRQLVNDHVAFKIYLGLLFEQAGNFNIDSSTGNHIPVTFKDQTLQQVLAAIAPNIDPIRNFIIQFGEKANKINGLIKNYKKTTNDSLAIEQYYNYFTTSIDLLQQCSQLTNIPAVHDLLKIDLTTEMKDYFDVARSAADLTLNITKRNYSAAVVNTVHIYDLVKAKAAEKNTKANTIVVSPATEAAAITTPVLNESLLTHVKEYLFKYGSFMAAIVQAKTSDEVESSIEAFALPAGSSRIKRETIFNVSLNAYCGLFIGHEKISGVTENQLFNTYGITAPIGFSASLGSKGGWSHSAFISLVDLGAVTAFRFTNNTAAQVPTIQLKDIFSPGLFYSLGIAKTPLSVNVGAQVGPNLRKVTIDNNDYSGKTYIRYSLSVCVDLPLLNLYTKSR